MAPPPRPLAGITLGVLFVGGLLAATFWVLRPFLPAVVWAVTLAVSTWPLLLWIERHTGHRRSIAVALVALALLTLLIIPLWLAGSAILTHANDAAALAKSIFSMQIPPPPGWVGELPVIGRPISDAWVELASLGVSEVAPRLSPYAGQVAAWIAAAIGSLAGAFVEFILVIVITAILHAQGEKAAAVAIRFGRRLGGERGAGAVLLAGRAMRSVAVGVVVTALAQSLVGGIGLFLAAVPAASLLVGVLFVLCLAQIGPAPVLLPAVVWLFYAGEATRGGILLLLSVIAMTMDNVLRPLLIRSGADLPLLLVLAGVIGGLLAMGLLGIFIGPTVLATAYTLFMAWIDETETPASAADPLEPAVVESGR